MPRQRPIGQRSAVSGASRFDDLESADHAPFVRRVDPRGGLGINAAKAGHENADALLGGFGFKRGSARWVARGELEVVDDTGDVEP